MMKIIVTSEKIKSVGASWIYDQFCWNNYKRKREVGNKRTSAGDRGAKKQNCWKCRSATCSGTDDEKVKKIMQDASALQTFCHFGTATVADTEKMKKATTSQELEE